METVIELADDFADDLSLQSASSESTTMPTKQPFVIGENLTIIVICFPFASISLVIALVTIIMHFFFQGLLVELHLGKQLFAIWSSPGSVINALFL